MALRGCRLDTVEDMWIGFGVSNFKVFHDVVMYCKKNDAHEIIYCVKAKKATGNLLKQLLLGNSGDFSLSSHHESYERVKGSVKEFMGREIDFKCGFLTNMSVRPHNQTFLLPSDDNLFHIGANSETYCLNVEEITRNCSEQIMNEDYLSSIFFCTDQVDAPEMETAIQQELQVLLQTHFPSFDAKGFDLGPTTSSYLSFIGEWVQGELGDYRTLTKTVILYKLVELVMERYKVNLLGMPALAGVKKFAPIYTWNFLTNGKRLIALKATRDDLKFISDFILYKISKIYAGASNKTWGDQIEKTFTQGIVNSEILSCVSKFGYVYMEDLYKVLWKIGRVPLVVKVDSIEDYRNLLAVLRLIHFSIDVILISTFPPSELPILKDVPVLVRSLFDLDDTAKHFAFKLNICLQGKGPIKAHDVIDSTDPFILQQISLNDLITLMHGNFSVGNNLQGLPEIHIRRTIPRIGLQPSVLKCNGEFFLIRSTDESLKQYIESNIFLIMNFFSEQNVRIEDYIFHTDSDNFDEYCKDLPPNKSLHYLQLHDSKQLEWIKSRGIVEMIGQFRKSLELEPLCVEGHFTHSVNIISADPGAGKSVLMQYLALMDTRSNWVIQIDLNKYSSYYVSADFMKKTADEHLRYFNRAILKSTESLSVLNELIFEYFLKKKIVLVLLDGYDEIAPLYTEEVSALALCLKDGGYPLWLTTRPVMRKHVETVLNTFSLTLNQFNDEEQTVLLTGYFKTYVKPKDYRQMKSVDNFVSAVLMNCRRYLNDFDNKIMGLPLRIFLLGQVFAQTCHEYVTTGYMGALKFDLLYLYDKFTKMKINIVVEKFGHSVKFTQKNLHENHCLFALKVLFSKEDLSDFGDYLDEKTAVFMDDIKDATDKTGIVVADVNTNFVHRSVSEYFAAKWLSENLNKSKFSATAHKLVKKIIDPNFYVIRNVFDRILAKKSALLTAVINQDVALVEDLIKENAEDLDSEGRNILCVAASWGETHDLPSVHNYSKASYSVEENSNASKIMALILKENIAYCSDSLLGYSPLDWAIKTNSLCAADQLLKKYSNEKLNIEAHIPNNYLCVCAKYNYVNFAEKILNDWNSSLFLQIDASIEGKTSLQLASERGNADMVRLLQDRGASTSLRSKDGFTALDCAKRNGHLGVSIMLSDDLNKISSPENSAYMAQVNLRRTRSIKELEDRRKAYRNAKIEELRQKRRDENN